MTMRILKQIVMLLVTLFVGVFAMSQKVTTNQLKKAEKQKRISAIVKQEEEGLVHFSKHWAMGLKLVNDGYGGWFEYSKIRHPKKNLVFQIDFAERKHVKEEKLQNQYAPTSPVIFGKVNFFYPLKLGVQQQWSIGNKGNRNGVSISVNAGGGVVLGLLRPYLVEVNKGNGVNEFVSYNSPDSVYFVNLSSIEGGPSFSKGWNKMKIKPGMYAKAGLRFDYGKYNEMISAIEVGGFSEFYSGRIQQMIDLKQHQLFLGAYVSVIFGRRK